MANLHTDQHIFTYANEAQLNMQTRQMNMQVRST